MMKFPGRRAVLIVFLVFAVLIIITVMVTRSVVTARQADAARWSEQWAQAVERIGGSPSAAIVWPGVVPDDENAAVPLRALRAVWDAMQERERETLSGIPSQTEVDFGDVRAVFSAHPQLLVHAQEAAMRPSFRPDGMTMEPGSPDAWEGEIGDLIGLRRAMLVLHAAAIERAERGDLRGASDAAAQISDLVRHMEGMPSLISALVAMAGDRLMLGALRRAMESHVLPDQDEWIEQLDPLRPQRLLARGLVGDVHISPSVFGKVQGRTGLQRVLLSIAGFDPEQSRMRYLHAMTLATDEVMRPAAEQDWAAVSALVADDRMASLFFPSLDRSAQQASTLAQERMALRLMLLARSGRLLPASEAATTDPISGRPMRVEGAGDRLRIVVAAPAARVPANAAADEVLLDWPADAAGTVELPQATEPEAPADQSDSSPPPESAPR